MRGGGPGGFGSLSRSCLLRPLPIILCIHVTSHHASPRLAIERVGAKSRGVLIFFLGLRFFWGKGEESGREGRLRERGLDPTMDSKVFVKSPYLGIFIAFSGATLFAGGFFFFFWGGQKSERAQARKHELELDKKGLDMGLDCAGCVRDRYVR